MDSKVEQLHSQAKSLADQFDQGGRTTRRYIDDAIVLAREALELCPPSHHKRSESLTSLSIHLSDRYAQYGAIADIEEGIVLDREALALRPHDDHNRGLSLNNLAFRLSTRYQRFGRISDLDEAITLTREALTLRPEGHPLRSSSLDNLAHYLSGRYEKFGGISDLDEAITLAQEGLELQQKGHPHRSLSLDNLATYFSGRYNKFGKISDLDEAITLTKEALTLRPEGHPHRSSSLNNLAYYLSGRYDKFGKISDLDEAITLTQEALMLRPEGHPHRPLSLDHLAICFSSRYNKFGRISDLDEAITLAQEGLTLRPEGHPDRSLSLNNLAHYFSCRYDKSGRISDLDEAITLTQEALTLHQEGHPHRSSPLSNLAIYFYSRYNKFGRISDLDEAITLAKEALILHPEGHPHHSSSLDNLAIYLSDRYNKFSNISDLEEAITLAQEALMLRPEGHPHRSLSLDNLATYLSGRYDKFGRISDLDEAIALSQESLMLRPECHPHRSLSLSNLAHYLSGRYNKFAKISDLDEAITLAREGLVLRPDGHPLRWSSLINLAAYFSTRYNKLGGRHHLNESSNDLEEAFRFYAMFADSSYSVSSGDLQGCREWICAAEKFKHSSTCLAYETSLRLLVEHIALLPSLPEHLTILKEHTSSLAIDAFSALLRNGSPKRAVELLEQGRGVFWNQLTRLHSSLDDVTTSGAAGKMLADRFAHSTTLIRTAMHSSEKDEHDRLFHLNLEMQNIVVAIRKLPGLSRFLLPPLFEDLQRAASKGPVIIVNASQYGRDVLIIADNRDPVHIPLSITKEYLQLLSLKLRNLPRRGNSRDISNVLGTVLRELWEDVVFRIVHSLQEIYPLGSRIWWCPTGEFCDLPLHAAGPYRRGHPNLSDLYISSYAPTLSSLIRARRTHATETSLDAKRFIAIGQANAIGQSKLLTVDSELARICLDVGSAAEFKQIDGEASRIPLVAEELVKNEWVHFACHGVANRKEPFKSAFALRDGHFTIEQIIRCDLGNPEFAYLSACQTTVGDEESPDEAIHLAAAMQFLGFRSVIGTMWSVADKDTKVITSTFYQHMLNESGRLDHTRAAFALNETMRTISGVTLDQRVVYIHLGA